MSTNNYEPLLNSIRDAYRLTEYLDFEKICPLFIKFLNIEPPEKELAILREKRYNSFKNGKSFYDEKINDLDDRKYGYVLVLYNISCIILLNKELILKWKRKEFIKEDYSKIPELWGQCRLFEEYLNESHIEFPDIFKIPTTAESVSGSLFTSVNLKYINKLTYSFRQINDIWRRYPHPDIRVQQENWEFTKRMRGEYDNMIKETQTYLQTVETDRMFKFLEDLLFEVQENQRIYKEKEDVLKTIDYSKFDEQIVGFQNNWYKPIYEQSRLAEQFILKFDVTGKRKSYIESNSELNIIEKLLIIQLLIDKGLFPKQTSLHTNKQYNTFLSAIIDENVESIKRQWKRVGEILNGPTSPRQAIERIKNVEKIKSIFEIIVHSSDQIKDIITQLSELLDELIEKKDFL